MSIPATKTFSFAALPRAVADSVENSRGATELVARTGPKTEERIPGQWIRMAFQSACQTAHAFVRLLVYLRHFVPAVLRKHWIKHPATAFLLTRRHCLRAEQIEAWRRLYNCQHKATSFEYLMPASSHLLFQTLRRLQVNFRNVLLLQHEVTFHREVGAREPIPTSGHYRVTGGFHHLRIRGRNRVIVTCHASAQRIGDDDPFYSTVDTFLVKNVSESNVRELLKSLPEASSLDQDHTENEARSSVASPQRTHPLQITSSRALAFGLLSGDLNLAHIHPRLSRLFGCRRAFAQGLFTSNYIMAVLTETFAAAPGTLRIRFLKPVYLGQTVQLRFSEHRFDVVDAKQSTLATGSFEF